MLRTKVLIIGGGPAGSSAARFLAKENIDAILVEKKLSFVKPCGGGMPSGAFDELDIPKDSIKKKVKKVKVVSPSGDEVEMRIDRGFIAIVKRGEFDSALRTMATESGAVLINGEFMGLTYSSGQIVACINTGDREEKIKADYIIAADGVNSRVRLALGLELPLSLYTITGQIKGPLVDSCEFWFGSAHAPNSYSWVFPDAEGVSAGTGGYKPLILRRSFNAFLERRGIKLLSSAKMYKIPSWDGALYNKGNVIFAGDSAGHVMPLTYEGIYHAMKAGEFAARAVMAGNPDDYKKMWKSRFYKRFMIMKGLCRHFLRNDKSMEKLVSLFGRKEVQNMGMRLWLDKSSGSTGLASLMTIFRRALG